MLRVGRREAFERQWYRDGAEVTTGTVTFYAIRRTVTGREWWTGSAWQAAEAAFASAVAHDGKAFTTALDVPAAWDDASVTVLGIHSDATLPPLPETHYVTTNDLDDVEAKISAATKIGDVDFGGE